MATESVHKSNDAQDDLDEALLALSQAHALIEQLAMTAPAGQPLGPALAGVLRLLSGVDELTTRAYHKLPRDAHPGGEGDAAIPQADLLADTPAGKAFRAMCLVGTLQELAAAREQSSESVTLQIAEDLLVDVHQHLSGAAA